MRIRFITIIILVLMVSIGCSEKSEKGSSDWVEYTKNNGYVFFYNKVSIKHRTKDIVQVWEKIVYSDEGREKLIQREGPTKKPDTLDLWEIDCKKGMYRILSYTDYDTDGKVLDSGSSDQGKWIYIVLGSVMEDLQKIVCK